MVIDIGKQFRWGRQEDSHEFLRYLIDSVQQSAIAVHSLRTRRRVQQQETEIFSIFGGFLQSQVRCLVCGYESNTIEPFMDLSLEVTSKECTSLHSALDAFCAPEILDGVNRYKCPQYSSLFISQFLNLFRVVYFVMIPSMRFFLILNCLIDANKKYVQ